MCLSVSSKRRTMQITGIVVLAVFIVSFTSGAPTENSQTKVKIINYKSSFIAYPIIFGRNTSWFFIHLFQFLANLSSNQSNSTKRPHYYIEHDLRTWNSCSSGSTPLLFWEIAEWSCFAEKSFATNSDLKRSLYLVLTLSSSEWRLFPTKQWLLRWERKSIFWNVYELIFWHYIKTNEFQKIAQMNISACKYVIRWKKIEWINFWNYFSQLYEYSFLLSTMNLLSKTRLFTWMMLTTQFT